jgi:flagellar biosynthetic protein FlhB
MSESQGDSQDKSHDPTEQRLRRAREQGQVVQSKELNTFALYVGLLGICLAAGAWMVTYLGDHLMIFLTFPDSMLGTDNATSMGSLTGDTMGYLFLGLAPLLCVFIALPLGSLVIQQSFTYAPDKLMPKLNRISPLQGFKNKFGLKALVEFGKSLVKVFALGWVIWWILKPLLETSPSLVSSDMRHLTPLLGTVLFKILIAVTVVSAVIGIFDYLWQRFTFMQEMRMSLEEIKEEIKETDGDPHFKQHRRERGRQIALNSMLKDVQKADVIITNPTHYAIALHWSRKAGTAPLCVAKGVDDIALTIRKRAEEYFVPIQENVMLARSLYATLEIGQEVREEDYQAVAAAIRFALDVRKKRKKRPYETV